MFTCIQAPKTLDNRFQYPERHRCRAVLHWWLADHISAWKFTLREEQ